MPIEHRNSTNSQGDEMNRNQTFGMTLFVALFTSVSFSSENNGKLFEAFPYSNSELPETTIQGRFLEIPVDSITGCAHSPVSRLLTGTERKKNDSELTERSNCANLKLKICPA
jgi:hypothetical protein